MQDVDKTKEQLIVEVAQLRQRIAELEAAETERKKTEEALRKSEEKYRTVIEISPDGIAIASKGRHVFANKSLAKIFGVSGPDELLGKPVIDYIHPEYRKIVNERLEQQTKRGELAPLLEEKMLRADGSVIYTEVAAAPLEYEGAQAVLAVIRDITDRKQAEEALRIKDHAIASSIIPIAIAEFGGNLTYVNPAFLRMWGYENEEEVVGKPAVEFWHEQKKARKIIEALLKGGDITDELVAMRKDGSLFDVQLSASVVADEAGKPVSMMASFVDITERKRAEEALRESEERYRTLVDNIDLGINLIDSDHNIVMVNASMGEKYNKPISEIIRKKCFQEFEKRDAICPYCPGVQTMATGQPAEVETKGVRDDGSRFAVKLKTYPIFGQDGKTAAFIEIAEDITERKQSEKALRESEGKYRSLVESSEDSIYLVDKDCTYLFMNKKHLSRLGLESSKVIGRAYGEFHSHEETSDFRKKIIKVFKTGKSLSYGYRSERDNRYFIRTLSPIKASEDGEPTAATVISKDITEVKLAEEALREREAFNFALFHYNPVETIVVDRDGRVIGFNLAKEKSGDRLPTIGDLMYKDYAGKHEIDMRAELMACIKSGNVKAFSERRYGDRFFSITISPFSQGALIISEDITERLQAQEELQSSREQLRNLTTYLESVREQERTVIAREIHDELAQALTALKMDLSWLNNRLPRDNMPLRAKTRSMNDLIDTTIKTVKRISAELRPGILDDLGLVAAIEWQAEEFQDRTGITCHVTVEPEDIRVDQDRATAIFRIFQETLTNIARHARATRVIVSLKEKKGAHTLSVRDNGIGITEKQIADSKAFGLIGIRERVHPWGGKVSMKGIPGKGTTVLVRVPVEKG